MAVNSVIRMKELVAKLKEADTAYFTNDNPIMPDREYDLLVEELKKLEAETGVTFAGSPTNKVSGEVKGGLATVRHSKPMLSAKKTKSVAEVESFAANKSVVLSWKMDGLTIVLRYENGLFKQAVTRGSDGIIGEDVTHTVKLFRNIPHRVSYKKTFEVRGEGVISWTDFETFSKKSSEQSHPRNFAAGAVRAYSADRAKCSHLDFFAFELIMDEKNEPKQKIDQLDFLTSLGFCSVPYKLVSASRDMNELSERIEEFDPASFSYPVDGVVVEYNDIEYGRSLGATAHHENRMIALKWKDEVCQTQFLGVDLVTTRTGVVSIVAKFKPISIEGSMVKRASLHNLSIFERLQLGEGDTISVYKANMIIPQIAENLTKSGTYKLPEYCNCCGEKLTVRVSSGGVKDLFCPNDQCIARNAQKIARFCDKTALNIEGLSATTLEKLMSYGWVKDFKDLYHLDDHRDEICGTRGFGVAAYEKIHSAVEKSRNCSLSGFLVGVGIPLLGAQVAKTLDQYFYGDWNKFEDALKNNFHFAHIDGISGVLEKNIYKWYENKSEEKLWRPVLSELNIASRAGGAGGKQTKIYDANVVVTGTIIGMTRKQITEVLTLMGAKVTETVTQNTDLLIVGMMPGGKKLGAAMANNIPIMTESQFAQLLMN